MPGSSRLKVQQRGGARRAAPRIPPAAEPSQNEYTKPVAPVPQAAPEAEEETTDDEPTAEWPSPASDSSLDAVVVPSEGYSLKKFIVISIGTMWN
jgi:hypothetical protein